MCAALLSGRLILTCFEIRDGEEARKLTAKTHI